VFKLRAGNDLEMQWYCFGIQRSKVKVAWSITHTTQ